jgi:hypothetical protein
MLCYAAALAPCHLPHTTCPLSQNVPLHTTLQAGEMYDRVMAVDPSHWRACLNKGVVQYAEGAKVEAKELLNSAFVMSGHHPEVFQEIKVGLVWWCGWVICGEQGQGTQGAHRGRLGVCCAGGCW